MPGGPQRAKKIIARVLALSEDDTQKTLNQTLRDFSERHRNISRIFERHFNEVEHFVQEAGIDPERLPKSGASLSDRTSPTNTASNRLPFSIPPSSKTPIRPTLRMDKNVSSSASVLPERDISRPSSSGEASLIKIIILNSRHRDDWWMKPKPSSGMSITKRASSRNL